MAQKRTTLRSLAGTKLYPKRSNTGQFTDIQTYKRAHGSDVKRRAKPKAGGERPDPPQTAARTPDREE